MIIVAESPSTDGTAATTATKDESRRRQQRKKQIKAQTRAT